VTEAAAKHGRALILGGAGFIGSHIANAFLECNWQLGIVDGLVSGTGGTQRNIADVEAFTLLHKIEDVADLTERLQWADWIIDAMGFTGHLAGFDNPRMDIEPNLLSHLHLIQNLRSIPGKRIVYLASRGQYGASQSDVITEESPCQPLDPQGINKLAVEHLFRIYSKAYGFDAVSLRLTNCFGPQQKMSGETGLVASFIQSTLDGKQIELFGNAERTKDLLFAGDVARIVFEITQTAWSGFEVFNVGGTEVTLKKLLETIFIAAGSGSYSVKPFPDHVKRIDVGEARFSDDKLTKLLGNRHRAPLGEAIRSTVEYFKQNQGSDRP
jgi:UDP-glucose 4-epimerase